MTETMKPQGDMRDFPLRVVLTVTTGRLLTEGSGPDDNGIGDLYEILGHMTGDSPFTHQLPRFGDECKPWLLRWYPELKTVVVPEFESPIDVDAWVKTLDGDARYRSTYAIGQIPRDDHDVKHPYDELVAMRGTDEGIIIV